MQGSTNLLNLPKLDPANDQVANGATASQTGACLIYNVTSAASINAASIKASAGRIYSMYVGNGDASAAYFVKLYDQATTPDPSADSANGKVQIPVMAVSEISIPFGPGIGFANGIGIAITAAPGFADETNAAANDVFVVIAYK